VTRPSALVRFVALAVGLIIAGCQSGGEGSASPSTGGSAAASEVSVTAPTSLVKAGTVTDCVDIEYPPMEYFPSTSTPHVRWPRPGGFRSRSGTCPSRVSSPT